ncbi:hypothetical protein [Bacteroides sp.]|uniref:hypothetical protein n=1 Tax=Bacteroides sp. TaxID=29523 RepID=UPI0025C10E7B|nr:hypothetical protein [Bacteroides sp.]
MSKEIVVSVSAELWIKEHLNKDIRLAKLVEVNKIMCQIVRDQADDLINDSVAFDMLLTLANLSTFIESLGE